MAKFLDQAGLQVVWNAIKDKFESKEQLVQELLNYTSKIELAEELANYVLKSDFEGFKKIVSDAGEALIFNEIDGGGVKFTDKNGNASFVGVNQDVDGGIGAQLYDINIAENKGSKLDVTKNGIFYTVGDESAKPAVQRDVEANELATKKDIQAIEVPEYSLRKELEPGDFAAIYHLTKDGEDIGEAINIAKDQLLKSVEVKVCTEKDVPIEGLEIGDKYLDFTFIVEKGEEVHRYIAIKDMVKPYTAGEGIVITSDNVITFDQEVIASVEYVDASISDTMNFIIQERDAERAGRIAGDELLAADIAKKVDKQVSGTNGEAYIFNEQDGGGAKFVNKDGLESFVGVNDGGENGLAAQIYADKFVDGKWTGAKIDVTNDAIYYTVGNKSFAERAVEANEIATIGDINENVQSMTEAEIRDICK